MYRVERPVEQVSSGRLTLTELEAADRLNISRRMLSILRARGEIPYIRLGIKGVRYRPCDLDAWIASALVPRKAE